MPEVTSKDPDMPKGFHINHGSGHTIFVMDYVQEREWSGAFGVSGVDEAHFSLKELDFTKVTTIGNRSFIPLEISQVSPSIILNILDKFDKSRPGLKMGTWFLKEALLGKCGDTLEMFVWGIYINHEPKETK